MEPSRKMHPHAYILTYFCINDAADVMILGLILA